MGTMRHVPPLPSIDEARATLLAAVRPLPPVNVPVADALGLVLAEDVTAAHDVPGFANSAMVGFAVRAGQAGQRLRIAGESRAGAPYVGTVVEGEAVRISTGAALPAGADGVLQVELVEVDGDAVVLHEEVAPGRNVRDAGDDLRAGKTVLRAGRGSARPSWASRSARAGWRCSRAPRPRVAVVTTGDELVEPGHALEPGQIHDSNGPTLAALAARAGAEVVGRGHAVDDPEATRAVIGQALDEADVLILSGGVSVGCPRRACRWTPPSCRPPRRRPRRRHRAPRPPPPAVRGPRRAGR